MNFDWIFVLKKDEKEENKKQNKINNIKMKFMESGWILIKFLC